MYELKNIEHNFENFLLKIDSLSIKRNRTYAIVGPNGSGKSTVLNLLSFLDQPRKGDIFFDKNKINFNDKPGLLKNRRRISYFLQNPYLFNSTVYNNVAYGLKLRKIPSNIINEKTIRILEKLLLINLKDRSIHSLSGGEAQRVAMARNLAIEADVYLFDEPTSNIDRENIYLIEDIIGNLKNDATVVFTTHSRGQAYRLTDKVISIFNGQIKGIPYENIFSGFVGNFENHLKTISINGSTNIKFNYTSGGSSNSYGSSKNKITVAIDPNDIIISKEKLISSALNSFLGTINKVEVYNGSLQVFIDTGVIFCALITHKSFKELGFNIGSKVWITFKANSVKIISEGNK